MGERKRCKGCGRSVSTTPAGVLYRHNAAGMPCIGSGLAYWTDPGPPPHPTVRPMLGGARMAGSYYDAPGCAEQHKRGRITSTDGFHYEGNSTEIPGARLWCSADDLGVLDGPRRLLVDVDGEICEVTDGT